jgi:hypothetical protein
MRIDVELSGHGTVYLVRPITRAGRRAVVRPSTVASDRSSGTVDEGLTVKWRTRR